MDCGLLGSSNHGISKGRILEWVTVPSSRGSSQPRIKPESHVSSTGRQVLSHKRHWALWSSALGGASSLQWKLLLTM